MTDDGIRPELSRRIAVARLPEGGAEHRIEADAAERAALMRRFGLLGLDRFTALVRVERLGHGAVRVDSTIAADLAQECVVTLEPVPQHIEDHAVLVYRREAPSHEEESAAGEVEFELLTGDEIDIGEAAAQQLSLALDPFPRAAGAALDAVGEVDAESRPAPAFAALERLRKR